MPQKDWFHELEARANAIEGLSTTSSSKYDEFKSWIEAELGGTPAVCFLSELSKQWTPRVGQALMGMPKVLVLLVRGDSIGDARERLSPLHRYVTGLHASIVLTGTDGEWRSGLVAGTQGRALYERLAQIRPELTRDITQAAESGSSQQSDDVSGLGDFMSMEPVDQGELIWECLIGRGPLELDEAIRGAANALRDEGRLSFERLRRDGPIYFAIEQAIAWCARRGELFDRPTRGCVRAVITDVSRFPRDYWRDCILAVVGSTWVTRDDLVRAAADRAVDVYGLDMQRLRSGGRTDTAIRSALNGLIRRGQLERSGAHLLRRANDLSVAAEANDGHPLEGASPAGVTSHAHAAEAADFRPEAVLGPASEVLVASELRALLGDIPGEAEAVLAQLLGLPLKPISDLSNAVARHLKDFVDAFEVHQFLDINGAERLAEDSRRLLDRWPALSMAEKHLAQAAILYFVDSDEADDDFRIGGLRTDKLVMDAVNRVVWRELAAAT